MAFMAGIVTLASVIFLLIILVPIFLNKNRLKQDDLFKTAQIFGSVGAALMVAMGIFFGLSFNSLEICNDLSCAKCPIFESLFGLGEMLFYLGINLCAVALFMALIALFFIKTNT